MSLIPSFFCAFKQTKAHAFFLLFNSRKEGEPWQSRTRVRTDERVADGNLIPRNLLPPQPPFPPQFSIPFLFRPAKADNLSPTSPPFPSTKARSGTSRENSGGRGTMQLNTVIANGREKKRHPDKRDKVKKEEQDRMMNVCLLISEQTRRLMRFPAE